ncbi:MAG: hypothetical protein KME06_16645 [Kastovskya adunca ATA6-11-RM4]|jgi:hypothetical protein|nr:hypothetical protein [Kastovskya adunca ATA6-11-RM4]
MAEISDGKIEKADGLFFLQPVVMEYVTERFVQQICIEFETQQLNFLQTHTLLRVQAKEYIREIKPLRSFQIWKS